MPPSWRRLAGREPSRRREISSTGVTALKKRTKSGSRGRGAVGALGAVGHRLHDPRWRSARGGVRRAASPSPVATSAALVVSSSSRWAISATAYLAASTSPCSVIFSRPPTVPGGSARIATFVGPPPRPSDPPRPWKKTHEASWRRRTAAVRSCAR
jgi:hypothetical protein